jgi:hypothetical protein
MGTVSKSYRSWHLFRIQSGKYLLVQLQYIRELDLTNWSFLLSSSIRAFEKLPLMCHTDSNVQYFSRFYQLDRSSDKPEPLITLFPRLSYCPYRHPPPVLPEFPVSQRLSSLCSLMNNEVRAFLYGPSSQDPARDIWLGNTDRPCGKELSDADSRLPPESSPSKPE